MKHRPDFHVLVTSGPTHEPIDPVRFLGNRSSGKQGHAIAQAFQSAGARVTLVSGPVSLPDPPGVQVVRVTTAREMLAACEAALPAQVAVCAAAVADWRVKPSRNKLKKSGDAPPTLTLVENPDILRRLSRRKSGRPQLVVGFAAETERVLQNARAKRLRKGCDWMLANDVSGGKGFDADENCLTLITPERETPWPRLPKQRIAEMLVQHVMEFLC